MGVELSHDVADDAAALGERTVGAVPAVVHRVEHAAVHGLEPVTDLGQRTPDDHAHRVVQVGALHLELQVDALDASVLDGEPVLAEDLGSAGLRCQIVCHGVPRSRSGTFAVSVSGRQGCVVVDRLSRSRPARCPGT